MNVRIEYIDGQITDLHPSQWDRVRSDGVYKVTVSNNQGAVDYGGQSIYWCRKINGGFGIGSASFYQSHKAVEVRFDDDTQTIIPYVTPLDVGIPDLKHNEVKLGWWRGLEVE